MSEGLKFTVRYQRKVQPIPYENMTIGLEIEHIQPEGAIHEFMDLCFKEVRDLVEKWIHESLNPKREQQ